MVDYLALNVLKLGLSAGIIGAITIFWLTINGIYGKSKAYKLFEDSMWGRYGYSKSWSGAFIGLILGFIYAAVMVGLTALIYNALI